jgi:hypothetical protein
MQRLWKEREATFARRGNDAITSEHPPADQEPPRIS